MSYIIDIKDYHLFKENALKNDIKGRHVNASLD